MREMRSGISFSFMGKFDLLTVFLVCALLSDNTLQYICVPFICIAVSFLIGYLYEHYYYKKVQSRSNFFGLSVILFVFIVTFSPPFSGRLARWRKAVCRILSVCVVVSVLISIMAGRWWYEEINYTRQEIQVVHGKKQVYSFSDVTDYIWVKIDLDNPEDEEKTLVLYLSDGTVIDMMNESAYSTNQGDYSNEELKCWMQN